MARIVVINQSLAGSVHELGERWTTIGRADGNEFQLIEPSVSGRHCEVCVKDGKLRVRDLNSTNGTFVHNREISEAEVLPGETLRVGDIELRFESSASGVPSGASFNSKMLVSSLATAAVKAPPAATENVVQESGPASPDPGKKFHVLFVDDSMAFLESFGGLCAECSRHTWQVHTAASADQALARLQEITMDLVVLDIGMPMLDGLQLLGIIKRRHPGIRIVVITALATESKRADALGSGAELFLEKPVTAEGMKTVFNVLNDLLSWQREGFTGALRQVGLAEVIQVECNGRHSSILEVHNPEVRGRIFIKDGAVIHAAAGQLEGEPALYQLVSLRGGGFEVKPYQAPPQRTIQTAWEQLLMEAARIADEESFRISKPGSAPQPSWPAETPVDHGLGDEIVVVATYDGQWKQKDQSDQNKPAASKDNDNAET